MSTHTDSTITPIHPNPSDYAGFLVWQTANRWEKYINAKLAKAGINCSDMFHLISIFHLTTQDQNLSQITLSKFIGTTTMNTSKMLTKLEKLGLVTRTTGIDIRSKSILLTDKGCDLTMSLATSMKEADKSFYPKTTKKEFITYLQQLQ